MIDAVNVPKDRINVVKDRATKEKIEKSLNVKLSFDENSVIIEGDGIELLTAKNIVKAIGRGFAPVSAFRLLEEEETLEIIEMGKDSKKLSIVRSRLIGTGGKTRRMIEEFSGCSISVYGKTIALIGKYEQMNVAREAVKMILRGAKHSKVYSFLFDAKL